MVNQNKRLQEKEERRLLQFFDNPEARRAVAEDFPFLPRQVECPKWVKLIWYSDACGGKLITFKAGNPYTPKMGIRKDSEDISETAKETRRLKNSLSRTRKRIFEIAACNDWEWFFTGTLDGEKCDRNDLNGTFKRLSQWIRDYRKKQDGARITYLIVPEQHKDGAWHFHGLINGITEREMHKFSLHEKIPLRIKRTIQAGTDVWTWSAYADKFGYSTMTKVRDNNAVACYVTKYITKDMITQNATLGTRRHLYYASQGLNKPTTLAESYPETEYEPYFDFENDWVEVRKVATKEEADAIIKRYGLKEGDYEHNYTDNI